MEKVIRNLLLNNIKINLFGQKQNYKMNLQSPNQQRRKYYRSFQYRSASLDINPQKLDLKPEKLLSLSYRKPQLTKNDNRKGKRYLFQSQQKAKNFNKTLSTNLTKTKHLQLNSTIIRKQNPEEQETNFGTCTYIQSFEQLMQSQGKNLNSPKKLSAKSMKLQSIKKDIKIDRITLPSIIEYENSQFTALDPIRLPINSIQDDIQRTMKQMQECPQQLNSIRWEMKAFGERITQEAEKFQGQFLTGVNKLWDMLRKNNVYQQTFVLKAKRQVKDLTDFLPPFRNQFEAAIQKQLQIQTNIFQTAPFQLKINSLENETLQQKSQHQIQSKLSLPYF